MLRSNRKHYIPERDKKKILKKILRGAKLNTASEKIEFPAAVCGDKISVLQKCASVGVQKWPITRKWRPDESLVNKGYNDLEFHSRCNFNPFQPECEERAYLIGPKKFIEKNEDEYTAVFDEDDDSLSSCLHECNQLAMRRLTATRARFREIPDGFTKQPVVFAKTWDVSFIPKYDSDDAERRSPNFVKIENATEEALMEIYKHSEGFFVTSVNKGKRVTKRSRRISAVLKKEIKRQSVLKPSSIAISEEEATEKVPTPTLLKDILLSQLDRSPTDPSSWEAPAAWDVPPTTVALSDAKKSVEKSKVLWDISQIDHRTRSSISLNETITEVKYPREMQILAEKTPPSDGTEEDASKDKARRKSMQSSKMPFAHDTAVKTNKMKEIFSKDWEPPISVDSLSQKDLPSAFKDIIIAEDAKEEIVSDKISLLQIKEKDPGFASHMEALKAIDIQSSSDTKVVHFDDDGGKQMPDSKRRVQFRRVKKSNVEQLIMKLPDFEAPKKAETDDDKRKYEAKKKAQGQLASKPDKSRVKTKEEEEEEEKSLKSKTESDMVGKPPEMGKKDKSEYLRNTSTQEKEIPGRSTISSAWSRQRAVNKLQAKQIAEEKKVSKMIPVSQVKGKSKALHDTAVEDLDTVAASASRKRDKLTGIPELDLPEIEPLDVSQFELGPPSFEERSKRLTKKAKKQKQTKQKVVSADGIQAILDDFSTDEDLIASKMDSAKKPKVKDKDTAHTVSKLELYKHAKDRGQVKKKEKITEDLVDYDKPLRSISESLEAEKKSPFQLGENIKYTTSDERSKRTTTDDRSKRTISKGRTLTNSDTDNFEGKVQRVGDLDLLELSSDKKKGPGKRGLDSKLRFPDGKQLHKGKQRSSLRSKYGLHNTAFLTGEGKRSSVSQEGPEEAMYTFGRFPTNWASNHEMGAQPRFHFPIQLSVLDGLSPLEYLELYTSIPSRRLGVYQKIFNKHCVRKEIPMSVMKNALGDMVVGPFSKDDYMIIMSLVERNRAKSIPWNEFKLICCLTDRLMDDGGTASAVTPLTDYLQIADSYTMLSMLKEQTTNMSLTNLLNAVASCQLYY